MRPIALALLVLWVPGAAPALEYAVDFQDGLQGWAAGFADYPEGEEAFYELDSGHRALPSPFTGRNGFLVSGNNHSDDLFMFIKGAVPGFLPDTAYDVTFEVTFATAAGEGCVGVGGAPGEGVTLKGGATVVEPVAVPGGPGGNLVMNVDKGAQANGGADALVLGDVASPDADCSLTHYALKTLSNAGSPFPVTTDASGALWILFGTDSGFEATTTLYYLGAEVTAVPEASAALEFLVGLAALALPAAALSRRRSGPRPGPSRSASPRGTPAA